MAKKKDEKFASDFSKIIERILAGEKVDLTDYPTEFQELLELAEKLRGSEVAPSASFKGELKERLLVKMGENEARQKPGFGERLKQLWVQPIWQAVAAVFLVAVVGGTVWGLLLKPEGSFRDKTAENLGIKRFASAREFRDYLAQASAQQDFFGGFYPQVETMKMLSAPSEHGGQRLGNLGQGGAATEVPGRVSETTVQVKGIDEPDIVKTDGEIIYFSPNPVAQIQPFSPGTEIAPVPPESRLSQPPDVSLEVKAKVIKAFPPKSLGLEGEIEKSGDLLLNKNTLVVFSGQEITGYNVSNPKSPEKKWNMKLEDTTSVVTARLYKGKIYLITQTLINNQPEPSIKILNLNGASLNIEYKEIYHPIVTVPVDSTFSVLTLDPDSGETKSKVSFLGSSGSSVVYMSEKAVYVTYSYAENPMKFFQSFLIERGLGLVPSSTLDKVKKLSGYDISEAAKLFELQNIWQSYLNSLQDAEREGVQKELSKRMTNYYDQHKRDLEKTGIAKIGLDDLKILASGQVPGYPLNQFALDEYKGNLRIATTVGERGPQTFFPGFGEAKSSNDVYILGENLSIRGFVKDLGLTEKIYSVRFLEDKGFLVTFRQTDPFYVLELADPEKPKLKGELKIPGYSSYLQPISEDKVLGVGQEGAQVKASLFDVSNPEQPKELDKYILDATWSDVLQTHHAFLLDEKHQVFFVPGGQSGYIISYKGDKLSLAKKVEEISARRAIFLDDFLFIIGDDQIMVLDENNWEKVNELKF